MHEGSFFSAVSTTLVISYLVDNSDFNWFDVLSHYSFDLHSLDH